MTATPRPEAADLDVTEIDVGALVLDPTLQARVQVDDEVVRDYAQLLIDGVELPPIDVIAVDEGGRDPVFLVTDGFHRTLAHRSAQLRVARCRVRPGKRRDALLAALAANSAHGLHRTGKDKARAVRLALEDAQLCKLKGADLAERLSVSKSFVDGRRQAYGVKPGKVLDPDHADRVDGLMSKEWKAIAAQVQRHEMEDFEKVRLAPTPAKLIAAEPRWTGSAMTAAVKLRRAELAIEEWPWHDQETTAERRTEMVTCDTVDHLLQIAACAATREAGKLDEIYAAVTDARRLAGKATIQTWELNQIEARIRHRPALVARVKELRSAAASAAPPKTRGDWRDEIRGAESDAARQVELVTTAPVDVFEYYCVPPWTLKGPAAEAFDARFKPAAPEACSIPGCATGWILAEPLPKASNVHGICARCGRRWKTWSDDAVAVLRKARELLLMPGVGIDLSIDGTDITLDRHALAYLASVQAAAGRMGGVRDEIVAELHRRVGADPVLTWLHASAPESVYVGLDEEGGEGEDDE